MSGIDLHSGADLDYEETHQAVLYWLFENSEFPRALLGLVKTKPVDVEPEGRLFDLAVTGNEGTVFVEIKMWSSLADSQLYRQRRFLEKTGQTGRYVLLGTSWFEFEDEKIQRASNNTATKIGYGELICALDKLLEIPGQRQELYKLAQVYRKAIQVQLNDLKNAALTPRRRDKIFYYSLYRMLQDRLQGLETDIYSADNRGKTACILNNGRWWSLFVGGVATKLLCEVVNEKLCIKFIAATDNDDEKHRIRQQIRDAAHRFIDGGSGVIDAGRMGKVMTACQIDHDFTDIRNLDRSARLFRDVDAALPQIGRAISPVVERTYSKHSYKRTTAPTEYAGQSARPMSLAEKVRRNGS